MKKDNTNQLSIVSLVLGILAFLLGWIPLVGWLLIALGIGFGIAAVYNNKKDTKSIIGLVLSCLALVYIVILILIAIGLVFSGNKIIQEATNTCAEMNGTCVADKTLCESNITLHMTECDSELNLDKAFCCMPSK